MTEPTDPLAFPRPVNASYAVDDSGRIVSWSDAAERVLGFTRDEALGRHCYELLRGRDAFGNRYCGRLCPIRDAAASGEQPQPFAAVLEGLSAEHPLKISIQCVPQAGSELASVVHVVDGGEEEAAELIQKLREAARRITPPLEAPDASNPLTKREHEIVRLLAEGSPAKVVAARLGVSRATVRNHIQNVLRKLDVHGQVEAVSIAFRSGWL